MPLPNRVGYLVERRSGTDGSAFKFSSDPVAAYGLPQLASSPAQSNFSASQFPSPGVSGLFYGSGSCAPPDQAIKVSEVLEKTLSIESLSPEEVTGRKAYLASHPLLGPALSALETYRAALAGVLEEHRRTLADVLLIGGAADDFSIDEFIRMQGLEARLDQGELQERLEELKSRYESELRRINKAGTDFAGRVVSVLREQSAFRPLLESEVHLRLSAFNQKFAFLKNQLRQAVCSAVLHLLRSANGPNDDGKKKRRALGPKATEILNNWFFEHLEDPYPTEEEKAALAVSCNLTLSQVNNWFGNKRIRYKRKCFGAEGNQNGPHSQLDTALLGSPLSLSSHSHAPAL